MKPLETEVLIVGGGIVGTSIARELSKYKTDVMLVEKGGDVCSGVSKSGHGLVYNGLVMTYSLILKSIVAPDAHLYEPQSLKLRLCREGFELFDSLAEELDVPYRRLGVVVVARNQGDIHSLRKAQELAQEMGLKVERLSKEDVLALEPNVNPNVLSGLYQPPYEKLIFPPDLVIALAENARENGVRVLVDTEVRGVVSSNGYQLVQTNRDPIKARFIVNAAGKHADRVADMAGARDDWGLTFNRSQMLLLDKRLKGLVNNVVQGPPEPGAFDMVLPQLSGNPYIACGTYDPVEDKEDTATTREYYRSSVARVQTLVPTISERDVIAAFVGVREFNTRDPEEYIIEASGRNPQVINAVIRLPGLTPAPAIARTVVGILAEQGLELVEKKGFNPYRKAIPRFSELDDEARRGLIARDSRYGHVVCRCETVTEGEITEAICRGAGTVQGVKFRTRAGMGRCQGGFCGPRVVALLARELDIPHTQVTTRGGNSQVLFFKAKELLQSAEV